MARISALMTTPDATMHEVATPVPLMIVPIREGTTKQTITLVEYAVAISLKDGAEMEMTPRLAR